MPLYPSIAKSLNSVDVIPGSARFRGAKLIVGTVAQYLVPRLAGFHKLFENNAEGISALLQIIGT